MNQYYNYKKWRLARYNPTPTVGINGRYSSEGQESSPPPGPPRPGARVGNYSPTKEKIDQHSDQDSPGGKVSSSSPSMIENIHTGLNKLLGELKYVLPHSGDFSRPRVHIGEIEPGGFPFSSSYIKFGPTKFNASSYTTNERDHIERALADYAGSMFHNVLLGYTDQNNPNLLNYTGHHSNRYFPALDEMEESGNFPSLSDIPEDSTFNHRHIGISSVDAREGGNLKHRKSRNQSPLTEQMEDIALVAGHKGSQLYKEYLEKDHPGSFEDFLSDSNFEHASTKDKLLHDLIRQMVEGIHLPDK